MSDPQTTLKPCPFCGGAGKIETTPSVNASHISVAKCGGGLFGDGFASGLAGCGAAIVRANEIQAAEAWNERI